MNSLIRFSQHLFFRNEIKENNALYFQLIIFMNNSFFLGTGLDGQIITLEIHESKGNV